MESRQLFPSWTSLNRVSTNPPWSPQLLSDRGSNFLSELILEVCHLIGTKKINSTEVQNPWCKLYAVACIKSVEMFQKLSCLPYVFDSVLACAKLAHVRVSEVLILTLRTLSLSFLINSSSDSKAFQHFIAFSGSPTVVHRAFLFFAVKAWPVTN